MEFDLYGGQPNPIIYTKCPWCGGTETIARSVWEKKLAQQKEPVPHLKKEINILEQPMGLTVPAFIRLFDQCLACGREYVVWVEFQKLPTMNQDPRWKA